MSVEIDSWLEIGNDRHLYEVDKSRVGREIDKLKFFLFLGRLVIVQLFHELTIAFGGVLDGFLLFNNFWLFSKWVRSGAFELDVAENASSLRVLAFESIGADELIYGFHAEANGVADF